MDLEEIRRFCREQFAVDDEDRGTLIPCPACDGSGLVRLDTDDTGQSYRMYGCPWCDGRGSTTSHMIKLYREFQREGHV
jgi:DnaJ-class molecular chaperone